MKNKFNAYIQNLQNQITSNGEEVDGVAKFREDIRLQDKGRVVVLATETISNMMCRCAVTDVTEDVFSYEWKCAISEVFEQQGQISAGISYNKEEKNHVILCARKKALDKITKFRDELSNKM